MSKDLLELRQEFPILDRDINGVKVAYFDSAASNLKPKSVVDVISNHYLLGASNVHRGVHRLSDMATSAFEKSREKVRSFLGASELEEVIFTKGTTDSINLVAHGLGKKFRDGDVIAISEMEHHSNIVPWQINIPNSKIVKIPVTERGEVDMNAYREILAKERPKIVAITHISNSLGTANPVEDMTRMAHEVGSLVLVDGAQAVAHRNVDVKNIDCDFYALSGHKIFGPTGIGVLYGKRNVLEQLPPYQGGGAMIDRVKFDGTTFADLPHRLEAGTPHIAGVIGLGAALDFVKEVGMSNIVTLEKRLHHYMLENLRSLDFVSIVGEPSDWSSIVSFNLKGLHHQDVGSVLDQEGVAVRTGHHCTQPLMERFGITGTVRASLSVFNNENDIDRLSKGLKKAWELLS